VVVRGTPGGDPFLGYPEEVGQVLFVKLGRDELDQGINTSEFLACKILLLNFAYDGYYYLPGKMKCMGEMYFGDDT
jgi:hypothetical protein